MKSLRTLTLLILISAAFGCLASCSKTSTSPIVTTAAGPIPTIGSTFITVDDNGFTTYDTVVATTSTDAAHPGSTVREFTETNGSNGGVTLIYESYLTDGDLAIEGTSSGWGPPGDYLVLPFASHTTVIDTLNYGYGGNVFFDTVTAVYSGSGMSFHLNNQTYATDSVTVNSKLVGQYGYSFIPSLGLIANYTRGGYSQWLTAYSPK